MNKLLSESNIRVTNIDYFTFLNTLFFLFMCTSVYYDRFISYRGQANIHEFFIYAVIIFITIVLFWLKYRHLEVMFSLLFLVQIGVLMHFSGAFIEVDGHRLYDSHFFDIRYDKYVHFVNSSITTIIVLYVLSINNITLTKIMLFMTVMTVLGLGGIVEIIEFIVTLTVPHNGVGTYNNNMLDLVANFLGAISILLTYHFFNKNR